MPEISWVQLHETGPFRGPPFELRVCTSSGPAPLTILGTGGRTVDCYDYALPTWEGILSASVNARDLIVWTENTPPTTTRKVQEQI